MTLRRTFFISNNKVCHHDFEISWNKGFAISQKQKNIDALHKAISEHFNCNSKKILEVSTKSKSELGRMLSSFNLKIFIDGSSYFLESAYQSSKVFNDLLGEIQFEELLYVDPRQAKKKLSNVDHTKLVKFNFFGIDFPLSPTYLFYDWLYINSIKNIENLPQMIKEYDLFTDIEFSPSKSKSCQARSLTLYKWLILNDKIDVYLKNPFIFYKNIKC